MKIIDGLINMVANLAAGNSKRVFDQFVASEVPPQQLNAMYRGDWLSRKVVDLPVKDIMRPWRGWQAEADQISAIEETEKRHNIRVKIATALIYDRLYGGAAIVIGGGRLVSPMTELKPEHVTRGGLRHITPLRRIDIQPAEAETDPLSENFGLPKYYTLKSDRGSVDIHPSRVIRIVGTPRHDIETNPECWGDSILQVISDALKNAGLAMTGVAELIHEAKVDVVKMHDMMEMLATNEGTAQLVKRFQNASLLKSINNTLLLDKNDDWDRKQTSFAGLPDLIQAYLQIVAGASDIPVTRLLGTSPKGLNSTGEHDTRNYYDFLDGLRVDVLQPILDRLDPFLWCDAIGSVPPDAFFEFNPLWQMTEKEKADISKLKSETTKNYASLGLMPEEPFARALINQLIEDGTYPGLEAEIGDLLESDEPIVPEDVPDDDVRPSGNGPRKAEASGGSARDRAIDWGRARSEAFAGLDDLFDPEGSPRTTH
ncbi:DUF1073 domain-containing protein [Hyphomicrobium sp. CS1GBMeth3]|uniref:DUF1073 domain-containing protein n=1 Tax=Hyphomicrobium sp. CS1GBMeth3 TaxID=1892845 RepID=UPI000931549D|nr:DUF1073 domain-containing protein [Hyphomicrobium sp. CS1GBMeth3]